jgi:hypothetical protein
MHNGIFVDSSTEPGLPSIIEELKVQCEVTKIINVAVFAIRLLKLEGG